MVLKYDYAFAARFYYNTISDSYKITYLKWGGGALALLIIQIVLTRIARKNTAPNGATTKNLRIKFKLGRRRINLGKISDRLLRAD